METGTLGGLAVLTLTPVSATGRGNFLDARLDNAQQYPVAAKARLGHKQVGPDLVAAHLGPLHFYQLALPVPKAEAGSFDPTAAGRGQSTFNGKGRCATCHVPPLFTESGWNVHKPSEIGIDDFQANRSPDKSYRTAPLRGLMTHAKGSAEKRDLMEYLKSL